MKKLKILTPSSPVLLPAERREGERSETDRSAAGSSLPSPPPPNPEVVARAQRRRFTADYKQSILEQADQARVPGAIGALLRREGLFSSHLTAWRRERQTGVRQALTAHPRGPKSTRHPLAEENHKLQRDNQRLAEQLRKAEIIIDIQKKVAALLGHPIGHPDQETQP